MPSRRGLDCDHMCSLSSVTELISMADSPTANWSTGSTPLTWTKTAVGSSPKTVRMDRAISESRH